jgi:hypothetical protein
MPAEKNSFYYYICIYGLFNDAVSRADNGASSGRMNDE